MPPKVTAVPLAAGQQVLTQDTSGIKSEYMLPYQREQYRRHLQTINDLQGRKLHEPNNPQLDAGIAEARNQLNQLSSAAAENEKRYPTPELFAQYANQYQQTLQQASPSSSAPAAATNPTAALNEKLRVIQQRSQQMSNRLREIQETLATPGTTAQEKDTLNAEYERIYKQLETVKEMFRNNPGSQAANLVSTLQAAVGQNAASPSSSQSQPAASSAPIPSPLQSTSPLTTSTQSIAPAVTTGQIPRPVQPSTQPTPSLTVSTSGISMGQIPRPTVNTGVGPARPNLSGAYPFGNPSLGAISPAVPPHTLHAPQSGETRLLSKRRLEELVRSIDPDLQLEPDAEEVIFHLVLVAYNSW